MQLILSGDFLQLEPVIRNRHELLSEDVFCFASPMWKMRIDFNILLTAVHRQSQVELICVLDDIRFGNLSEFTTNFLIHNLSRPLPCGPLDIVRLSSHVKDAREANAACLSFIPGESISYQSKDSGDISKLGSCTAPKTLILKPNAKVVLLRNIDSELVNGLCGYVYSMVGRYPLVKFDNGKTSLIKEFLFTVEQGGSVVATRMQIPLDLSYALTIHRSQGMEFDYLEVHLDKIFGPGQGYVALSRAKTVEGLRVVGKVNKLPPVSHKVIQFYKQNVIPVQDLDLDAIEMQEKNTTVYCFPSFDTCKPSLLASRTPEPEEIVLTKDYSDRNVPGDALQDIIKDIMTECDFSQDCCDVVNEIKLTEKSIPNGVGKFFTWLWCVFSQINEAKSTTENAVSIDKKKWTGHTKKIPELYCSKQILLKWKGCLLLDKVAISDEDINVGGKHRKAAIKFARLAYEIYIHHQAKVSKEIFFNNPSNFKEGPVEFLTKEAKGKVRDISGWVISEETKSCIAYINSHKGSKSQPIMDKVIMLKKVKRLLDSMSQTQMETVENTQYPETPEHILTYDRGGKTHVSDTVFDFFIDLATCSVAICSEKNLHQYKENALSIALLKYKRKCFTAKEISEPSY